MKSLGSSTYIGGLRYPVPFWIAGCGDNVTTLSVGPGQAPALARGSASARSPKSDRLQRGIDRNLELR